MWATLPGGRGEQLHADFQTHNSLDWTALPLTRSLNLSVNLLTCLVLVKMQTRAEFGDGINGTWAYTELGKTITIVHIHYAC